MSIPPLVCSTPPPPDQCEDDKDHEEFDISYNLSQEDDEDSTEYNYGNYSSYNIYQTKPENILKEKWNSNLSNISEDKNEEKVKSDKIINGVNCISSNDLAKENITKLEEIVIEDLNLIVNDIVHSNDDKSQVDDTEIDTEIECSDRHTGIQDEGGTDISIQDDNTDFGVPTLTNNLSIPNENEHLDIENENIVMSTIEETISDTVEFPQDLPCRTNDTEAPTFTIHSTDILSEQPSISQAPVTKIKDESLADDDFGDFADFQLTSSEDYQVLSVNNENPWGNDCSEGSEFGNFTANFDVKESKPLGRLAETCEIRNNTSLEDCEEDFGDFGDFRSSDNIDVIADTKEATSTPDVTLWNLHSPDNDLQVVDSINTLLTSIFVKEIPEPENELLGKLESFLSETWGHLIDIDVRQPYMVNWNNSLGQKTLLKALSIDSRNILFGPKWNYNMPKYAVNLSAAPLQPQKQAAVSSSSNTESIEKISNKESGAWVDPFTPDGQEYTYAEALLLDLEHLMATLDQMAHKHSTLKISELLSHACNPDNEAVAIATTKRPTDLNVFEGETSTKLNKIYSSTINVQPFRHINLPDTHIFTPTDSETPRSKTIHYDSAPSALVSEPVQDNNKSQQENPSLEINDTVEKEYWDFQDFKGSNTVISSTSTISQTVEKTVINSTNENVMTYQTQILQPIKIEPIIPTLNWPDPGEVKETFDDFSDFISNTSWNNEKENQTASSLDIHNVKPKPHNVKEEVFKNESVDDDFETFQSAPASTSAMDFSLSSTVGSQISESDNFTAKVVENCDTSSIKVESNSKKFNNQTVENQSSSMTNNMSNMQEFSFPQTSSGIPNISNDILQPTSSSGLNRQQHKSDQILQPLSLESYSQINWPNPGIDLQDLSRFNPINSLNSLKSESISGNSKSASPAHNSVNIVSNQTADDDIWGDFVSSVPKQQQQTPKKSPTFADDEEWTDFVSSPSIKPQNGLNTISFNVHTNLSMQKSSTQNKFGPRNNQIPLDIPTLNYITPKSNNRGIYSEKHFQNL